MRTNGTNLAQRMAAFEKLCEERCVRLTSQRLEVFRVLAQATDHPTVETIHRRVLKRLPRTSLDTVYRTLSFFEEKQVLMRVGGISGSARFEANMTPHHHFICKGCGLILDVHSARVDEARLAEKLPKGFALESAHIELRGTCPKCRHAAPRTATRNGS